MSYSIELKDQPAQPTLIIRTRSSVQHLGKVLGPAFEAVMEYLGELGKQPAGPSFVVYYNDDLQNLDMGIGFPVSKALPGKGEVQASAIPAGKYATCLYIGSYRHISAAYDALAQWMKDNGYEGTGSSYEMYLNDASKTPPEELQTLVMLPVKG
jgi:effector-binding domain-containing protein